ncbi:hypothetical protein GCM10009647_087650 [Streptomyces sanglieri]
MRGQAKSLLKQGIAKFRIKTHDTNSETEDNSAKYTQILRGAISLQKPFNIVQIGANDGVHGDPIYDFVKEYKHSTNIILVEPVETLIPHLKENYAYHPSAEIVNKAIGDMSSIRLYGVKKEYWADVDVEYGEDWPEYRIPTGVTTTDKDRLTEWIAKNVQSKSKTEEIIETFDVDVSQPGSLVERSQIMDEVHLLQVDTEGMDDEIVYSFLEGGTHPNIINIERKHLTKEREEEYNQKLADKGYELCDYTWREKLALRR